MTSNISVAEWRRLGDVLLECSKKMAVVFHRLAEQVRRAFDAAFNHEATRESILHLMRRTRYARGQGKKKPRGRRAKREMMMAWRAHLEMLRARRVDVLMPVQVGQFETSVSYTRALA